ncbi:CAP domain-containing protein [Streptomyces griseofuscus]|uniref:CAP domain-containing protein n=1 Tax=Streptomyces griseofuscus TaxID=146922 RepID=UPI0036B71EDC
MGRHRRSDAGRAAEGDDPRASAAGSDDPTAAPTAPTPMGTAPYLNPEAYAAARAKADAYLFAAGPGVPHPEPGAPGGPPSGSGAAEDPGEHPGAGPGDGPGEDPEEGPTSGARRQRQAGRAVSMTLLGMCVAVALGTAAVAAGVVPGFQGYRLDGSTHTTGGDRIRAAGSPSNTADAQGGTSGSADNGGTGIGGGTSTGAGTGTGGSASGQGAVRSPSSAAPTPSSSPTKSPSASPSGSVSPSASPTPSKSAKPTASAPSAKPTAPRTTPAAPGTLKPKPSPTRAKPSPTPTKTAAPSPTTPPVTVSAQAAAEAEVLKLVNDERAKAGCSALSANSALTNLAESFSDDMAARGFFSDTDPDGKSPWDRAKAAGVTGLGAENIARGPADPAAVVKAWMASPEHRANILNCDFHTLGVGVHFGAGGPWWTEEFGA